MSSITNHPLPKMNSKEAIELLVFFTDALNPRLAKRLRHTAKLARKLAIALNLEPDSINHIEMAGMVHDIGLLSLPKELQNKDVKLMSEEQYRLYCEHPVIAAITLENVPSLEAVGEIILYHHEYINGKGFPNGLWKDQIPLSSRILLVTSEYSQIITTWPREMRKLMSQARRYITGDDWKNFTFSEDPESVIEDSAEKILLKNSEGKYDTNVVNALIKMIHKEKNIPLTSMVNLDDLEEGMILMEDIRKENGRLLITKGTILVKKSIQSLQGLGLHGVIPGNINVSLPDQNE